LEKLEKSANELKKSNETIEGVCKRGTEILKKSVAEQVLQLTNVRSLVDRLVQTLEENVNGLKKSNETIGNTCKRETEVLKKSVTEQVTELNNLESVVKKIIETLEKKVMVDVGKSTTRDRKAQNSARVINVSEKITGDREAEQAQLHKLLDLLGNPK